VFVLYNPQHGLDMGEFSQELRTGEFRRVGKDVGDVAPYTKDRYRNAANMVKETRPMMNARKNID
jgi:hypothetical protein